MSNNSGSATAPAKEAQPSQRDGRRGAARGRCSNRTKSQTTKFKGKCEQLKGFIYKISLSGPDSFTKVNCEVMEYVACTIPGAGEFHTAMINMQLDPLTEPKFPPDPDAADLARLVEIWREDHKLFFQATRGASEGYDADIPNCPWTMWSCYARMVAWC